MKFDSNLAWKQASAAISTNREVVLALAGVFFLLPGLAIALLFPQPDPAANLSQEQMMAVFGDYYASILPVALPMVLFQAVGTLGLLTLLTDRTRPTVGEALKLGIKGIVPYLLAQILLGIAIGIVGGALLAITGASGVVAIAAIGIVGAVAIIAYVAIKTSLVAPVIVIEGERNPFQALKRSWQLTSGNSVRIALFYLLVVLAFLVVILIATAIIGIVLSLLAGSEVGQVVGAVVSSALNAFMALYFVAIIAAIHRQLAGESSMTIGQTFE